MHIDFGPTAGELAPTEEQCAQIRAVLLRPDHEVVVTNPPATPAAFDPSTATFGELADMVAYLLALLKEKNLLQ